LKIKDNIMVALNVEPDRYDDEIEEWSEAGGMQRFSRSNRCAYPVQSHASKIRGIVRSRATAGARRKSHAIAGFKRRHRSRSHWEYAR
jgi:hypothetical protein